MDFRYLILLLSLCTYSEAQLIFPTPTSTSSKDQLIAKAEADGLHPVNVPYTATHYGPFVRQVHAANGAPPEVVACGKIEFISGYGLLKTIDLGDGKTLPVYANPYPYVGIDLLYGDPAAPTEEYIESGMGYSKLSTDKFKFFTPYIRRDPDTQGYPLDSQNSLSSEWVHNKRGDVVLPSYWQIDPDKLTDMMPITGEFCISVRFDSDKNQYNYRVSINGKELDPMIVASQRSMAPDAAHAKILSYQIRILTSMATTNDSYDPKDSVYKDSAFGVSWRAAVRPDGGAWEPFDAHDFHIENGDFNGNVIFYNLSPWSPDPTHLH